MNITKIDNLNKLKYFSPNKVDKGNEFKQILDQKVSEVKETSLQINSDIRTDILEQGNKIVDLLDDYARELTNPLRTLKDIKPLVENSEREINIIETRVVDKGHNDEELERLVKALAVTANVAVLKFHRGDYI